ncbi:MAG: alanine racemase [Gammaproteobacteria bacterium]|nr:alanine racemase [Gammaproteobacteria bacterium]MCP5201200.1 alanine racemase [Gammaproteobacteria bacterium]
MTRPARAIIDPQAASHNLQLARRHAPGARVMAVIKADAYGHGIARMARLFDAADAFAVASLEEAVALREGGSSKPIVLLEGPFEAAEIATIVGLGLEVVVHTFEQIEMLRAARCRLPVWLKFDTGMHRLGFAPQRFAEIVAAARACAAPLRFMTHFANAHRRGDPSVAAQQLCFERMLGDTAGERSLANSGALLARPAAHADWVRPGLMLYGVSPLDDEPAAALGLRPVMTLRSRLIAVRRVAAGEAVGYGGAFVCPEEMPVGVVAYGYADGYPRHARTGTPVLVGGVRTQVIGNCSMDMMTVDLRPVPAAAFGDPVTLWGAGLPVEDVARASGTIPYELLCRVRMRAHYSEGAP